MMDQHWELKREIMATVQACIADRDPTPFVMSLDDNEEEYHAAVKFWQALTDGTGRIEGVRMETTPDQRNKGSRPFVLVFMREA